MVFPKGLGNENENPRLARINPPSSNDPSYLVSAIPPGFMAFIVSKRLFLYLRQAWEVAERIFSPF
ncbi:MAG: hypothetical protein NPINA01_14640 [Nitrospinaceae bacterium]|nr:MAG: hypothetical protein NPINA01_14640 [Nitrospinaceae bacterium]